MKLWSPDIDPRSIPDGVLHSEAARRRGQKRQTHGAGPGRPRTAERCACGAYTVAVAAKRRHRCVTAS